MKKNILFVQILLPLLSLLSVLFGFPSLADREGLLNQLLAPGPLIVGHKDLEGTKCLDCHGVGKGVEESKCLACHKEIDPYRKAKKGFHGLQTKDCIECHHDHKGRDNDTTKVNEDDFDHGLTGFKLDGEHAEISCKECHQKKRDKKPVRKTDIHYLESTKNCKDCHKRDDIHHYVGKFANQQCSECHSTKSWVDNLKFDHDKDTKFKLVESHSELQCDQCHFDKRKNPKYQWSKLQQAQCLACHEYFHKQTLSPKFKTPDCTKCHNQTIWKIEDFDHSKITGYAIKGRHADLECLECHKQTAAMTSMIVSQPQSQHNIKWVGLKKDCNQCHKDYHDYGKYKSKNLGDLLKCEKCHSETSWKDIHSFQHSRDTKMKIDGKHKELKCDACHMPFKVTASFKAPKRLSKEFNLIKKPSYHFNDLDKKACAACHINPHIGVFSKERLKMKCTECHNTKSWQMGKEGDDFDHTKTRFQLDGAHEQVKCDDCHKKDNKQRYKFPSFNQKFCIDCHKNVHLGQFNDKYSQKVCLECHDTESWKLFERMKDAEFKFNHKETKFNLVARHEKLKCQECHRYDGSKKRVFLFSLFDSKEVREIKYSLKSDPIEREFCEVCHENVHANQFNKKISSKKCTFCHTQENFITRLKFDHDLSRYPLRGAHLKTKCEDCHVSTKEPFRQGNLTPSFNSLLISLPPSAKDGKDSKKAADGSAANRLASTRLPASEAQTTNPAVTGKSWKWKYDKPDPKSIPHLKSKFMFPTMFKKDCAECHRDPHNSNFGNSCSQCHSEKDWKATKDFHKNFTLKGVHFTLACNECHKNDRHLAGLSNNCLFCHKKDDVHNGTLSSCGDCHRQEFWDASGFLHSLSRFPLRGAHRTLDCVECHSRGVYKGTLSECSDCHLQQALAVPTPNHTGFTNLMSCTSCHRNQFSFGSSQ